MAPRGEYHGEARPRTRLYSIWKSMRARCNTPSTGMYRYYGGRGIRVCEEWDSYLAFKEWALTAGYAVHLELDREDTDGDYTPANCRWVTHKVNANNRRRKRKPKVIIRPLHAERCQRGHRRTPDNLLPTGQCRTCHRDWQREHRRRKKELLCL